MGEISRQEEPDNYRETLVEEIKEAPKEKRKEILESAKENPAYQKARGKKIKTRENKEAADDEPSILIKHKVLYHGSGTSGIKKFKGAKETTVGEGLYCTSKPKDAINYAHHRSGSEKSSVIYEVSVENLKLLDLRNNENIKRVMQGYKSVLQYEADKTWTKIRGKQVISYIENLRFSFYINAIETIDSGNATTLKIQDIIGREGDLFTKYAQSQGYDGLITIEGGEGNFSKSNHDSYVIFDPEKAKVVREQKIKKEKK